MSVQQLEINPTINKAYFEQGVVKRMRTFFTRQYQDESTSGRRTFDWLFGVILPTFCFAFDPFIFREWGGHKGLLGDYQTFAYVLSFTLIMANAALLLFGGWFKKSNIYLSGLFAVGGIVALAIGLVLLPFSILGSIFLIGILGFTPLFTSFVYLRNAVMTFRTAQPYFRRASLIGAFVFAGALSVSIPILMNAKIHLF
ncbi:MAG TPA: hypothetical protein VGO50_19590 [Pyrinomonadaceae bacterium]|jgi:hypothetical protein|nr:hypothetical protein [Pyrinomonadaceae bacterium]